MLGDADCQAAPAPASRYKCNQVKQQLQSLLLWPLGPGHVFFFESIITVPSRQDPWQTTPSRPSRPRPTPNSARFPALSRPQGPAQATARHYKKTQLFEPSMFRLAHLTATVSGIAGRAWQSALSLHPFGHGPSQRDPRSMVLPLADDPACPGPVLQSLHRYPP